MLLKLLTHLDHTRFSSRVYSLLPSDGPITDAITALGIPVTSLGMGRGVAGGRQPVVVVDAVDAEASSTVW